MACTVTQLPSALQLDVNGDSMYKDMSSMQDMDSQPNSSSSRSPSPIVSVAITSCEHECQGIMNSDDDVMSDDAPFVENWNPCLYSLQLRAPKAFPLLSCHHTVSESDEETNHFGPGYHGLISKADAVEVLLDKPDGTFLIRRTMSNKIVLSFNYNQQTYHYTVICNDDGSLTYDEKDYGSMEELVNDSLILLYVEGNENIHQKLTQGQQQQSQNASCTWKRRRHAQYRRRRGRKGQDSQSSVDSVNFETESTDGGSPVPSLASLTEGTPSGGSSNLDHQGLQRGKGWRQKGSTKSERMCPTNTMGLLCIPRASSDSKSRSTGDLTGLLANLVQATVATEGIAVSRSSSTSSTYEKAHNFALATYRRATWCDLCHHFLWGLVLQGMSCQDCGMNIHKQCLQAALRHSDCIPSRKLIKKVFGVDLTTLVMVEGGTIPRIVRQSVAYIEKNCLELEGVYRLSGSTSKVLDLKEKFNDSEPVQWDEVIDSHIVTGSIKLYFRELPNPLISYDVYPLVIEAVKEFSSDISAFISKVRQILREKLPRSHYETLHFFMQHLSNIAAHSDVNKMKPHNLAVVFAPTLMKPLDDDGMSLASVQYQQGFIKRLIENFEGIFL